MVSLITHALLGQGQRCRKRATSLVVPRARAWTCRRVARHGRETAMAPSYSLFSRFVPCTAFRGIERNDRSDRLPSLSRATLPSGNRLPSTTVHRIRCTAMRAYIQDLLIKFCALRYPPLFVGFLHLAEIYWPITARGKFLTVSTPIAGCNVIVCLAS